MRLPAKSSARRCLLGASVRGIRAASGRAEQARAAAAAAARSRDMRSGNAPSLRSRNQLRSVRVIVRNASASHGMSASSNSRTSRLSGPGPKSRSTQPRAEHHVDLVDLRQADHRVQRRRASTRAFASSSVSRSAPAATRLAVLEKAGRQRPQSVPRLDRALAQQHLTLPFRQAADDDLRILVVDRAAGGADVARQRVAVGNAQLEALGAAVAAELHRASTIADHRRRLSHTRRRSLPSAIVLTLRSRHAPSIPRTRACRALRRSAPAEGRETDVERRLRAETSRLPSAGMQIGADQARVPRAARTRRSAPAARSRSARSPATARSRSRRRCRADGDSRLLRRQRRMDAGSRGATGARRV